MVAVTIPPTPLNTAIALLAAFPASAVIAAFTAAPAVPTAATPVAAYPIVWAVVATLLC